MKFNEYEKKAILTSEHNLNPLHVYCKLAKKMRCRLAKLIARFYEKTVYNTIFHKIIVAEIHHIRRSEELYQKGKRKGAN